jgi:hypothetical protein
VSEVSKKDDRVNAGLTETRERLAQTISHAAEIQLVVPALVSLVVRAPVDVCDNPEAKHHMRCSESASV